MTLVSIIAAGLIILLLIICAISLVLLGMFISNIIQLRTTTNNVVQLGVRRAQESSNAADSSSTKPVAVAGFNYTPKESHEETNH